MMSQDLKQRVKVAGIFLLQIYKVTTGTLLSLFVPQSCNNQICTVQENYENNETYHKITVYWNFFAMFTFFMYYLVELRREEWAIKYLDVDNNKSDNSLKDIIRSEPALDKTMDRLNKVYYYSLLANCVTYGINILLSIKVVKDGYHSSSTVSCFVSFVLLVLMKLYNSLEVAHQSVKHDKMMSAYMNEFVSFNVLDPDYIKDKADEEQIIQEPHSPESIQVDQVELQVQTDEEVASITCEDREQANLSEIETKFLEVVDKIVEQESLIPGTGESNNQSTN
jgi:DNA-directed RNA polymerase subunit F